MARTKAPSKLLGLVESDSEDDLGAPRGRATTTTNVPSAKSRPLVASAVSAPTTTAASKVGKPAQKKTVTSAATRRAAEQKGAAVAAALEAEYLTTKPNPRSKRALADKTNEMPAKPAKETAAAKPKGRPGRKAAAPEAFAVQEVEELEPEESSGVPKKRARGRAKAVDRTTNENEDPRDSRSAFVEVTAMDVDRYNGEAEEEEAAHQETDVIDTMEEEPDESKSSNAAYSHQSPPVAISAAYARGCASTSSSIDDPSVRRRLSELASKYDALESQYRELKEIGVKEAERNFDRLKKQGEDRAKISNDLITSLRAELATLREQARDGAKAKRELEASDARASDLQAQVGELQQALAEAKATSKTLSTKLAVARTAAEIPALPAGIAVPGSAIKSSAPTTASARAAVEAMQANSQIAQLKEDLYGDLTGLLVRSALRQGGREMYDCIQTGRNGSLHFKLCIGEEDAADSNDSESAQFVYTPQLDPRRDAALMEMLPDYLAEEISFSRLQAPKFYKRVTQALAEEL
ncbi:hypothetical protein SEPCBS57363_003511 [Sporothrix epigloea]|uniref:Monopolin complex subunit Csm1/Pcs1 C-terminal domain-containing protein n=1 Tax=Sporothrix epigloea TaxID=1892477 RepID=A0ABP0DLU9_9PEZI